MILTIAHKELRSLFTTPSNWIILGILQFIFSWFFLARLDAFLQIQNQLAQLLNAPGVTQSVATPLLGTLAFILMMLVPVFTMRLIAEESRNQTLVILLAAPISSKEIILGKFFGLFIFFTLIIAASFLMLLTLSLGTRLDFGLLINSILGLILLTASYVALGLYISTLSSQPIVAATATMAILLGLWLIDAAGSSSGMALLALSPTVHFQSFNNGLLSSLDAAYFILFTTLFLMLSIRRLHNLRIYGSQA